MRTGLPLCLAAMPALLPFLPRKKLEAEGGPYTAAAAAPAAAAAAARLSKPRLGRALVLRFFTVPSSSSSPLELVLADLLPGFVGELSSSEPSPPAETAPELLAAGDELWPMELGDLLGPVLLTLGALAAKPIMDLAPIPCLNDWKPGDEARPPARGALHAAAALSAAFPQLAALGAAEARAKPAPEELLNELKACFAALCA